MRVALLAPVVAAVACGGARPPLRPTFADGTPVRIVDGGQVYDALDTTTCVRWPSDDVKRRAGRAAWGAFRPDTGLEGKVVATLAHCDGRTHVVLVAVGDAVVPVTSRGVERVADGRPPLSQQLAGLGGATYGLEDFEALLLGAGGEGYGGMIGALAGDGGDWGGGEVSDVLENDGDWGGEGPYDLGYGEGDLGDVGGYPGGYDVDTPISWPIGQRMRITDPGLVYSTINETDCLDWPSDAVRARAGVGGWGSYYPAAGDQGELLAALRHCDSGVYVLLLDVGGNVVPVESGGATPLKYDAGPMP